MIFFLVFCTMDTEKYYFSILGYQQCILNFQLNYGHLVFYLQFY